jgi:hypothetical protein
MFHHVPWVCHSAAVILNISTCSTNNLLFIGDQKNHSYASICLYSVTGHIDVTWNIVGTVYPLSFFLSFLGFTAQLRPWPLPQNPAEFLGGFSTIFFFTG